MEKPIKWKLVGHEFKTSEFFLRQEDIEITPELRARMLKIVKRARAEMFYPYLGRKSNNDDYKVLNLKNGPNPYHWLLGIFKYWLLGI